MYQSFLCLPKHILRPSPLVQSNLLTQAMGWNIGCQVKGWRMSERSYKAQSDVGLTRWQVKIPCQVICVWKGPNHLTRYKIPCQVIWVYLGDKCWSIPGANNYSSGSNTAGSKHRPVEQGPHLGNHSLRTLSVSSDHIERAMSLSKSYSWFSFRCSFGDIHQLHVLLPILLF